MPKYPGKKLPSNNNEVDLNLDTNIDAVQLAALNEDTNRGSSKPGSIIHGQSITGGTTSDAVLSPVKSDGHSPYITNSATNQAIIEQLYNDHSALFNTRTINTVEVDSAAKLKLAILGERWTDPVTSTKLAVWIPNMDQAETTSLTQAKDPDRLCRGRWTYSTPIPYTSSKVYNFWCISPEAMLWIINGGVTAPGYDDGSGPVTITSLNDITYQMMDDDSLIEAALDDIRFKGKRLKSVVRYLSSRAKEFNVGYEPNPPAAEQISARSGANSELWWISLSNLIFGFIDPASAPAIDSSIDDIDQSIRSDPTKQATGFEVIQVNKEIYGRPVKSSGSPITVSSTILDPTNLSSRPDQFTIQVSYDSATYSNLQSVLFTSSADYDKLSGKSFDISVYKGSVEQDASGGGPASIQFHQDFRPVQMEGGDPVDDQYNEGSVIPAINRVHSKANIASKSAVELNQLLKGSAFGNWNSSSVDDIWNQPEIDALSAKGYDTNQIALSRLNLIPILSGDRILEKIPKLDNDGNLVYSQYGVQQFDTITQQDRAAKTAEYRKENHYSHPGSDTPPTTVLEALWSQWKHVTNLTTDTYGISALTDVDIIDDKHELLDPIKLNSFIENFNLLYTMTDGLSGQMDSIKLALSGIAPGDTLIDPLSTYSVYQNLNNIYTNTLANSACCENVSLSAAQNETDIASLSAFALKLESQIGVGGGGGITMCDGEDICTVLTGLHDTLINLNNPGGFDIHFPSSGLKKHFKPDQKYDPIGTACENIVKPDSDTYKYHESVTGAADIEYHMWQHVDNSWNIGTQVCDVTMKIDNPDNLPIDQLTTPPGDPIVQITGPYDDFTTKLKRVIDYVDNPPVTPADIQDLDDQILDIEKDIEALSGCCDLNTSNVVELSAFVHGDPNTNQLHDDLLPRENLVSVINKLYSQISSLEESGGDPTNAAEIVKNLLKININTTNISTISGDLITLGDDVTSIVTDVTTISGDVIHNTNLIDINTNNINNINLNIDQIETNVDAISGKVEDLEQCCEDSLKIDDISLHAVTLTGDQFINGEKTFADTLTVSTSAVIGDNMTIGEGPTAFSVCSDQATGLSYIQIHNIITDPVSVVALPAGTIYAKTVQDGGETRKQLYIS